MMGFIGTSLQLQSLITAHNQWLSETRSIPSWTTSVYSSAEANGRWIISAHILNWLLTSLTTQVESNRVESHVTTDGQSARVSWNKAPIRSLRPDLYYCQTVAGLLMLGALSDQTTGLSFTTAAGLRQGSHSRVRVPWDSRPYFTVSDSSPTTRRAAVEVFDPASTRDDFYYE
jgi:hypothetical protein